MLEQLSEEGTVLIPSALILRYIPNSWITAFEYDRNKHEFHATAIVTPSEKRQDANVTEIEYEILMNDAARIAATIKHPDLLTNPHYRATTRENHVRYDEYVLKNTEFSFEGRIIREKFISSNNAGVMVIEFKGPFRAEKHYGLVLK